jgi:hypothetical protein
LDVKNEYPEKTRETIKETQSTLIRSSLKTPRAAAIAGIIFAVLYGTSRVLLHLAIPPDMIPDALWLGANAGMASFALNLIPFAGIAFLWFIGVIRDLLGEMEDRLFATVFLGSGLLFLVLTFIAGALAGGMLSAILQSNTITETGLYTFNRAVLYQIINIYSIRMAGVFMISMGTIWLRTGLMHRGWAYLTFVLALVLLLSIQFSFWVILIFPVWVFVVSVLILIRNLRRQPLESPGGM